MVRAALRSVGVRRGLPRRGGPLRSEGPLSPPAARRAALMELEPESAVRVSACRGPGEVCWRLEHAELVAVRVGQDVPVPVVLDHCRVRDDLCAEVDQSMHFDVEVRGAQIQVHPVLTEFGVGCLLQEQLPRPPRCSATSWRYGPDCGCGMS